MRQISSVVAVVCAMLLVGCNSKFTPSAPIITHGVGWETSSASKGAVSPVVSAPEGVAKEATGRYADLSLLEPDESRLYRDNFHQFKVHEGEIRELLLARGGREAISAGLDGKVMLSRISSNSRSIVGAHGQGPANGRAFEVQVEELLASQKPILSMALSPSERYMAVSWFSYVLIYDFEEKAPIAEMTRVLGRITSLQWDPREELLLLGLASGDVYVWNFSSRANTLDELESYIASVSPIIGVAFHPLGRSFFAVEEEGNVSLWRLLRTEEEIGLRDSATMADRKPLGKTKQDFNFNGARLLDMYLDQSGNFLYLAGEDGKIRVLKVRGLKPVSTIEASSDAVISLSSVTMSSTRGYSSRSRVSSSSVTPLGTELLVSSARDQRLKFWCGNQLLVFESELLKEPLTVVRGYPGTSILWGAQKNR